MFAIPLDYHAPSFIPGDYLAPELEDPIEYIEKNDYVRIERLVRRDDAPDEYGFIVRTRPDIQWALVRFEGSAKSEWFWIDEIVLIWKADAVRVGALAASTATNAR
jgi:hypothetical protein